MRMIDEDEVGLKEKPEELDTSKILHRNKTRCSTDSVDEGLDSDLCHYRTADTGTVINPWMVLGGGEIHTQVHRRPHDCWLY